MSDMPANDTRSMIDVLRESLIGADRVVIETRNALGEMDAHYLHAPAVLADLPPTREQIMADERVQALVEAAYLAGFNATGEGYNAEWPFFDYGKDPENDADWIEARDAALAALTESP